MKKLAIPDYIRFLFEVYLTGLVFFTLFRVILLLTNLDKMASVPAPRTGLFLKSFWMGFRFDSVISGYILLVPFLVMGVVSFIRKIDVSGLARWLTLCIGIVYSICFFICLVDIPFFGYFFSRLSTAVFGWIDSPAFMFKLVFQEVTYWIFLIPLLMSVLLFWRILGGIRKKIWIDREGPTSLTGLRFVLNRGFFFLLMLMVLFTGIRGRLAIKSPIRVGTAYFSSYAFPDQLGLNPVFTLMRSVLDDLDDEAPRLKAIPEKEALELVRGFFKAGDPESYSSPVARRVIAEGSPLRANVVLVIMESMSAAYLSRYGNPCGLTPHLDELICKAYAFNHIYTSGIHTYSGIYSSLFAFPVEMRRNPLKQVSIPLYQGIASELGSRGYQTIYFTTHDDQFDNIGGFLRANGFERIVSEKDYPSERVLSTLGVADDYMFEVSIPILNRLHDRGRPFLAVFMTSSNHPPYIIPENIPFRPGSQGIKNRAVEYADWALGKFLDLASRQTWYGNTLFVFVADHGTYVNSRYDLPLCFFHTPLIIYGPGLLEGPRSIDKIGGQIDIFPTVMGMLNLSYVNNTFGIDLLREERPYIYFSGDDKIGCLNHDAYLIIRSDDFQSLYRYPHGDPRDYSRHDKFLADQMRTYCLSMIQVARWMVKQRKVGILQ